MKKYKYKPKITNTKPIDIEKRMSDLMSKDPTKEANKIAKTNIPKTKKSITGLKNQVQRAINDVNNRLRRLEANDLTSSNMYQQVKEKYGVHPTITLDVQTKQGLMNKLKELKSYQRMKSSTLKGEREIIANNRKRMLERGIDFEGDVEKEKKMYELLDIFMERVKKNKRKNKKTYDSNQVEQAMYKIFKKRGVPTDINKFFANVRSTIYYWENSMNEDEGQTFKKLSNEPKEKSRTRPSRPSRE